MENTIPGILPVKATLTTVCLRYFCLPLLESTGFLALLQGWTFSLSFVMTLWNANSCPRGQGSGESLVALEARAQMSHWSGSSPWLGSYYLSWGEVSCCRSKFLFCRFFPSWLGYPGLRYPTTSIIIIIILWQRQFISSATKYCSIIAWVVDKFSAHRHQFQQRQIW